mmetsp:Transcript_7143/g.27351  ORF Transcript_7143/g.27351 Transcript_7143/m.27351 type:complete len:332 (-) Transcript_7143:78-1073(-)
MRLLAVFLVILPGGTGLIRQLAPQRTSLVGQLRSGRFGAGDSPRDSEVADLLTARTVETVATFFEALRDPVSRDWVKDFFKLHFEEEEHARTQAFLRRMMNSEPEEVTVKQLRRKRQGSPNNPFLKNDKPVFSYTVLIEPRVIADKIMDQREELAVEWIKDLQRISAENDSILRHYKDRSRSRQYVYSGDEIEVWNNSPHRSKNYQELKDVITERGITRALRSLRKADNRPALSWLEKIMAKAEEKGLRGDALLEGMIRGPMLLLPQRSENKLRVVEPEKVTELVMKSRVQVANDWMAELSSAAEVHKQLRAERISQMFDGSARRPGSAGQ